MQPKTVKYNEFNMPQGCFYCGREDAHEPNEFVAFDGGLVAGDVNQEETCKLSLNIMFHDNHSDHLSSDNGIGKKRIVQLVDIKGYHQFSVVFCSFDCLKKWFISHVDYLERHVHDK